MAVYAQGRNDVLTRQSLVLKQADGRMLDRARENADRFDGSHDAPLRSLSGTPPCGRKESGNDGRGIGCSDRCHRGGGRRGSAVVKPADQVEEQAITKLRGLHSESRDNPPQASKLIVVVEHLQG